MTTGSAAERAAQGEREAAPVVSLRVLPARGNLPVALSSFVGRERELAEAERLLRATRLLTLVGGGGCGKTRLALAMAAEREELAQFEDGVWWVDLAPLARGADVRQAVASALGVREEPGASLTDAIVRHVEPRELLLVLDNCEHVAPSCARLAEELLRRCPELVVLATSRAALELPGEVRWNVPALALPDEGETSSVRLAESEAVRLFVERARAASYRFELTDGNAPAVAEICWRLDGLPLAIELAAARAHLLAPRQIAARLDRALALLTRGGGSSTAHHASLEAALAWSYELLDDREQTVFRRLAVFAGGFDLEAAEAACQDEDAPGGNVPGLVTALEDKSLVSPAAASGDSVQRLRLLEPLRQFAAKKLATERAGELAATRHRHAAWCLALAESAEREMRGPEREQWLRRLATENGNLRAALGWGLAGSPESPLGPRLAASLAEYWLASGLVSEGRTWLEAALESKEAPAAVRAQLLRGAANLAVKQTDHAAARTWLEEAVGLYRSAGDLGGTARCLLGAGVMAMEGGDPAAARALYEESLALARELDNPVGVTIVLNNLANLATQYEGRPDVARALLEESLAIWRALGDKAGIALALTNLGGLANDAGDLAEARRLHEESLALAHETGEPGRIALAAGNVGAVAWRQGRFDEARRHLAEALELWQKIGSWRDVAWTLEEVAETAVHEGRPRTAATLLGAASALRRAHGVPLPPRERERIEADVGAARDHLGGEDYDAARYAGERLAPEAAIRLALAEEDAQPGWLPASPPPQARREAKARYGGLSTREQEVAALLAQGRSNEQIARELSVAVKTVEKHVGNILSRLGFDNRTQVAAWAVARGLVEAPVGSDRTQPAR